MHKNQDIQNKIVTILELQMHCRLQHMKTIRKKASFFFFNFNFFARTHQIGENREIKKQVDWGWEFLTRASRTSMTKSESLRRSRMARVAAAMWPGNQLTLPPPLMKLNSPIGNPFFTIFLTVPISLLSNSLCENLKPFSWSSQYFLKPCSNSPLSLSPLNSVFFSLHLSFRIFINYACLNY